MRIVMFTPAVTQSAIGRMAALISRELIVQGHALTVVRTEDRECLDLETHVFGTLLLPWTDSEGVRVAVDAADIVVHQVGNSHQFHVGNLEWLSYRRAIVCLHDFYLGHLFHGWACAHMNEARMVIEEWYGREQVDAFFQHSNSREFVELTCDVAPMTEWITSKAAGVLAHSSWGMGRVLRACSGPVWSLPLAYDIPAGEVVRKSLRDDTGVTRLLTIGHVNPNKRIESVIKAIAGSQVLRDKIAYRIVGRIEAPIAEKLAALARESGVSLVISGEVDDLVLSEAFNEADLVSCLRWPSLESASASAIEALLHGKPTLVTDTAFYSELPNDCVIKIPHAREVDALREALESLCSNKLGALRIGETAREWARKTFSAAAYARSVVRMGEALPHAEAVRSIPRYFAEIFAQWDAFDAIPIFVPSLEALRIFELPTEGFAPRVT